jgi:hypothetical protein
VRHVVRLARRGQPFLLPCRLALAAVRSWAGRAVLAWAVLAGLFFMHGAATAWTGGCHGGQLAMTASAMTTWSQATVAMPDAGSARPVAPKVAASPGGAVATRQAAVYASGESVSIAVAHSSDPHRGGMLCASRVPRQGFLSVPAIRLAAVLLLTAALMLLPCLGRASPRLRPPGRPGLPLPLFLGVSRT